ncbi:hypothetical protein C0991_005742, partial [Blastosporella zonata]
CQPINEENDKPGNGSDSDFATTTAQQEIARQHILPNHRRLLSMEEADNQDKEAYEQELAASLQDRDKDSKDVWTSWPDYAFKTKLRIINWPSKANTLEYNSAKYNFKHSSNGVTRDTIAMSNFLCKQDPESNNLECIWIVASDNDELELEDTDPALTNVALVSNSNEHVVIDVGNCLTYKKIRKGTIPKAGQKKRAVHTKNQDVQDDKGENERHAK